MSSDRDKAPGVARLGGQSSIGMEVAIKNSVMNLKKGDQS
jgi:hypothetical protein